MATAFLHINFGTILHALKPVFDLNCIHILDDFDSDSTIDNLVLVVKGWNVVQSFGLEDQLWMDHSSCAILCLTSKFDLFIEAFGASEHNPRLWWILMEDFTIPQAYWNDAELRLDSKTFLVTKTPLSADFIVKDLYRIDEKQDVIEGFCGSISSCDVFGSLWNRRSNLLGTELKVYYQEWAPMCFVNKETQELEGGIMFDLMETLAARLNVSVNYIRPDIVGVWGKRLPNGTWTGMVGDLIAGKVDSIIPGLIRNHDRHLAMDLTMAVVTTQANMFIRNPKTNDISLKAYTSEFTAEIWLSAIFVSLCSILTLFLIFLCLSSTSIPNKAKLSKSLEIVLRGALQKGHSTSTPLRSYSLRLSIWVVLVFEFIVFTSYRSAMNAFLTISVRRLPVNNLQDVIDQDYGMVMWSNGILENAFESSPKMSLMAKAYEYSRTQGKTTYMNNVREGLERVLTGNNVMFEYLASMAFEPEFPCDVAIVDGFPKFNVYISLPLQKNSPLTDVFNYHIHHFLEKGTIDKIIKGNMGLSDLSGLQCREVEKQVSLGLSNTILPFALMAFIGVGSLLVLIFECLWGRKFGMMRRNRWKKNSEMENRRKAILSDAQKVLDSDLSEFEKVSLLREMWKM